MPIMDGYESADKIRRYLQSLGIGQPIILAVTGHTEHHYVQRAIDCGMNQVFSKPLRGDLLKTILNMVGFFNTEAENQDTQKEQSTQFESVEINRMESEIQQEFVNMYKIKTYYQIDSHVSAFPAIPERQAWDMNNDEI